MLKKKSQTNIKITSIFFFISLIGVLLYFNFISAEDVFEEEVYIEMLVKSSDNSLVHGLPVENITEYLLKKEKAGSGKQGYVVSKRYSNETRQWGKHELDPKEFVIIQILQSQWNESWLEPEYNLDYLTCIDECDKTYKKDTEKHHDCVYECDEDFPFGKILTKRKYYIQIEDFLNSSEINDIENIEYNSKVNWSIIKDLTDSNNISDMIKINYYDNRYINITDVNEFKNQSEIKDWEQWIDSKNKTNLKLHGSAGTFEICEGGAGAGCDYSTLEDWADAQASSITSPCIANITGTWSNPDADGGWIDYGWSTTAAGYVLITTDAASGARHDGKYTPTAYRIIDSTSLHIPEDYVRYDGLQFIWTGDSDSVGALMADGGSGDVRYSNNLINSSGATSGGCIYPRNSGVVYIYNNIFYGCTDANYVGNIYVRDSSLLAYIYDNTIVGGSGYAIRLRDGVNATVKNTIAQDCAEDCYYTADSTWGGASTNNIASDTTTVGDNEQDSVNLDFIDESNHDYHLDSELDTEAVDSGVDLSSDPYFAFTTDIDGETRDASWDIGADEYVSGAPPDTCTYSSGTWEVDCSDYCSISSITDLGGENIVITGTGTFVTSANIINFGSLTIKGTDSSNKCHVYCNGGCFIK